MPRKQKSGSAAHLRALGRITLEYARLEQFMSHYLWALIARDASVGQAITAPMTYRQRSNLLRSLFHLVPTHGHEADIKGLEAILNRADEAVNQRNTIVHALIWHSGSDGKLEYTTLSKSAQWNSGTGTVDELHRISEGIYRGVVELSEFMIKHFGSNAFPPDDGKGTLWHPIQRTTLTMMGTIRGDNSSNAKANAKSKRS